MEIRGNSLKFIALTTPDNFIEFQSISTSFSKFLHCNLIFLILAFAIASCATTGGPPPAAGGMPPGANTSASRNQRPPEPQPPFISEVSPSHARRGQLLTIHGRNLIGKNVFVAFTGATVTGVGLSSDGTTLFVTVPLDAESGPLFACVDDVPSNTIEFAVDISVPVIASISPPEGRPGEVVILNGENLFGKIVTVRFKNQTTTEVGRFEDGIRLAVRVPVGAQSGHIDVIVDGNASNTLPFTLLSNGPPPVIHSIEPSSGRHGDVLSILGDGLWGTNVVVAFEGATTDDVVASPDGKKLGVRIPAGARSGNIIVAVDGRATNALHITISE